MGGGYTLCTTILHYNFWKRRRSFLGFSECRGFLLVVFYNKQEYETSSKRVMAIGVS